MTSQTRINAHLVAHGGIASFLFILAVLNVWVGSWLIGAATAVGGMACLWEGLRSQG